MQQAIAKLSPSAARLLLAFLTRDPQDDFDKIMLTSGIERYRTYLKAKQELVEKGILTMLENKLYLAQDEPGKGTE